MKKKYLFPIALGMAVTAISMASCTKTETPSSSSTEPTQSSTKESTSKGSTTTTKKEERLTTYYVSVDGTAEGKGTKESPLDYATAFGNAVAGDTILFLAGTYTPNYRVSLFKSGAAGKYITVKPASDDDRVIFDFYQQPFDGSNRGIQVYGDFWHIYGIEVCHAGDNGVYIAGNHNIIESCLFYGNSDTGLQLGRAYSNQTSIDEWPCYNLIKNCSSFGNYDAETLGENADGYAAKLTLGYGNVFDGCIAFRNSDDGWDMYAKSDSGSIGTAVLYNCVAFENGYLPYAHDKTDSDTTQTYDTINGDGIGFKLGGSTMTGDVILNNCLAFNNKLHGIGDNSNPGVISVTNCTAINNCTGIEKDADGNETGLISETRGITGTQNKSNNIDLARTNGSYNNYYGILSYTNNQTNFNAEESDSSYNADMFKGSVAYSIFNTGYKNGEVYRAFTGYEDASSYHSDTTDTAFSYGTAYEGMSDDCFASLESINATCDSFETMDTLSKYVKQLRNADDSVNLGDTCRVVDPTLLTYVEGKTAIGATLNKTSYEDYDHYGLGEITDDSLSDEELAVNDCYSVLEVLADEDAIYQDFELLTLMNNCSIKWTSSNTDVISIPTNEIISSSTAISVLAEVNAPDQDTKVVLTAEISYGSVTKTKTFNVTVRSRNQSLGKLVSNGSTAMRVNMYSTFVAPKIYAVDASSNTNSELAASKYTMEYSYRYTSDGSKYYKVDDVYTSVPGVYEVTCKATYLSDPTQTSTYVYNVYIVDPNCSIDLKSDPSYMLTRDGFTISGTLSNIEGMVYVLVSDTEISDVTYSDIRDNANVQSFHISSDQLYSEFTADNKNIKEGSTQYFVYYLITNANESNLTTATIRSFNVSIVEVSTLDDFYTLGTKGKLAGAPTDTPVIYSLTQDLDFKDYEWVINPKENCSAFTGLLNGNGHTISNVTIQGAAENQKTLTLNIFYKLQGTLMNMNFNEIHIISEDFDTDYGKQIGIIGDMQGGYLHNIKVTNFEGYAKESVGGLVGQVTGGKNYITQCSLVNPIPADGEENKYNISTTNKYAGGIVGNAQMNSDQSELLLSIKDCYVNANIGDGNDAGGNTGGILGRCKNDSKNYTIDIERCYYKGTITAHGQYNAGIVGDFDNGSGKITIKYCISLPVFIYNTMVLDADAVYAEYLRTGEPISQYYAHKNSNPIVGRAVSGTDGSYDTGYNFGNWREYYSTYVSSSSLTFDSVSIDDETGEVTYFKFTEKLLHNTMGYDLENVWNFDYDSQSFSLK